MESLKEMIGRHEGLRLYRYICPAGKPTIGYGWNLENPLPEDIRAHLNLFGCITEEQADRLLDISIDAALRQCRALYPGFDGFSEARRNALADFVFNVGAGTAMKFKKMMAAIERGDWNSAADEMIDSLWYRQVGNRAKEIVEMIRRG